MFSCLLNGCHFPSCLSFIFWILQVTKKQWSLKKNFKWLNIEARLLSHRFTYVLRKCTWDDMSFTQMQIHVPQWFTTSNALSIQSHILRKQFMPFPWSNQYDFFDASWTLPKRTVNPLINVACKKIFCLLRIQWFWIDSTVEFHCNGFYC